MRVLKRLKCRFGKDGHEWKTVICTRIGDYVHVCQRCGKREDIEHVWAKRARKK